MTRATALAAVLALTACHPARNAPAAVAAEQEQQLDDAANATELEAANGSNTADASSDR